MKLEEIPDPKPGHGEVLVRVKAAGVNPVDTYIRSGTYAMVKPPLPYTPGSDAAGILENGDRVYVARAPAGTYAELVACDAALVKPLPANVTFAQGAAVGVPYATAYRALFQKARAQRGETVLVHGASGGVGIAAVQWAVAAGMTVIGTAGTERGRQLVRQQGAHHVSDHNAGDEWTGRVNVIIEMLANVNLAKDLELLAPRGRVVVVGSRGNIEINPRLAMGRDLTMYGMALWNATAAELTEAHDAIAAGLANGSLRPVVGKELSLADAPRAHEEVMQPGAYGKIVLVP
jgi:NADPH2:quinone reductase